MHHRDTDGNISKPGGDIQIVKFHEEGAKRAQERIDAAKKKEEEEEKKIKHQ